jgi:hypothetical protein
MGNEINGAAGNAFWWTPRHESAPSRRGGLRRHLSLSTPRVRSRTPGRFARTPATPDSIASQKVEDA